MSRMQQLPHIHMGISVLLLSSTNAHRSMWVTVETINYKAVWKETKYPAEL